MNKEQLGTKYLLHPANQVVRKTEFKPRFPGFVAQKEAQKEYLRVKDINSETYTKAPFNLEGKKCASFIKQAFRN